MPTMESSPAKVLILVGIVCIVLGVLWHFFGDSLKLGRLPGDIRVEKENFKFYFPLVSSILVSVILSLIFWLYRWFMNGK